MLDAAPEDVRGIKPEDNAAGDEIAVEGRLAYRRDGGTLVALTAPGAPRPEPEPSVSLLQRVGASLGAHLDEWRASREGVAPDAWRHMQRANAASSARARGGYALATGPAGSVHGRLGRAVERAAAEQGIDLVHVTAEGTRESLELLRAEQMTAAVLRNTEATDPLHAAGEAAALYALAALYPVWWSCRTARSARRPSFSTNASASPAPLRQMRRRPRRCYAGMACPWTP
jgi:pyruvate/2-oxoglutarate dehydrogenase complex dihydrolipoamide acyltransferase (E2) component